MKVADICTRVVQTNETSATAADAARKMRDAHVGTLVVVEPYAMEPEIAGIVTDRDLVVRLLAGGSSPQATPVADIMTREVGTCRGRDGLFAAADAMRRFGVRRLPVLDDRNQLMGIISTDDIHAALGRFADILSQGMLREKLHEVESCD
jgi:CBS domain-containing protein